MLGKAADKNIHIIIFADNKITTSKTVMA